MRPVNHTDSLEIPKLEHIYLQMKLFNWNLMKSLFHLHWKLVSQPSSSNKCELNDLVRDLKLTKEQSELLSSRLKQWNLLEEGTESSVLGIVKKISLFISKCTIPYAFVTT